MKSRCVRVSLLLFTGLVALQLWAGQLNQSGQQVFTGEVTDTFCAKNKSHEEMMNENKTMGREKQTCAQRCVQMGAKYVLLDALKRGGLPARRPSKGCGVCGSGGACRR